MICDKLPAGVRGYGYTFFSRLAILAILRNSYVIIDSTATLKLI